jgi:hypothetical protein
MRKSKALQNKNNLVNQISRFFDKKIVNKIALSTKFVQRSSTFTGMDLLLLSVFSHQQDYKSSLQSYVGELINSGKQVTKQSLHERFNKNAVDFMQKMLAHALSQKLLLQRTLKATSFKRIIIGDATSYQIPTEFMHKYKGSGGNSSNSCLKIQYNYDLLSNKIIMLVPQSAHHADTKQELGEVKKTTYVSMT